MYVSYVIGRLDETGRIVSVRTCGESSQDMTRDLRQEWVTLSEASGASYAEARRAALKMYEFLFPLLSVRLYPTL